MSEITQQEFFEKYGKLISQTIKTNNVSYTTEKMSMYKGQRYYINTKDIYVFVLKMLDPTYVNEPRYMFYAEIKQDKASQKICGETAHAYYKEMLKKYRKMLNSPNSYIANCFLGDNAYRRSKSK